EVMDQASVCRFADHPQRLIVEADAIDALRIEPTSRLLIQRKRGIEADSVSAGSAGRRQSRDRFERQCLSGGGVESVVISLTVLVDTAAAYSRQLRDGDRGGRCLVRTFRLRAHRLRYHKKRKSVRNPLRGDQAEKVAAGFSARVHFHMYFD